MLIESPQNRHIKRLRSLSTRKGRRAHAQFLIEGVRALEEALGGTLEVVTVAICPELLAGERACELANELRGRGMPVLECTERAFRAFSQVQAPEGIAAAVAIPATKLDDLPESDLLVAAVEVRDPGNLGALVRTADAAGAGAFVAAGHCADSYDPKVVRATAGSIFHLPLVVDVSADDLLSWAAARGVHTVAAGLEDALPHTAIRYPLRTLVLVGNEANGLPAEIAARADVRARIVMPGRAESLNVAVAAGILLWEILRQRGRTNDRDGEK